MNELEQRENKVLDFMSAVDNSIKQKEDLEAFKKTDSYKMRYLQKTMEDAKERCAVYIICNLYKDALPMDAAYKSVYSNVLDDECKDFISSISQNKGVNAFVTGNPDKIPTPMNKLMYMVETYINNLYMEAGVNIKKMSISDLDFKFDDADKKRMDAISKSMSFDDVSKMIQKNVTLVANAEAEKAKKEQADEEALQTQLSNDPSMVSESAVKSILSLKNVNRSKFYQPSLFEGIMINKFNNIVTESTNDSDNDTAYFEAVREFTLHNVAKALKIVKYTPDKIKTLASSYASNRA